jgi:hypothetical protein
LVTTFMLWCRHFHLFKVMHHCVCTRIHH